MGQKTALNQFLREIKNYTYPNRIAARIPVRFVRFVTIHGVKIRCSHPAIGPESFAFMKSGIYEEPERECVSRLLRKGDTVLELGGGCGFISSIIWKTGLAKKIHVVEASPEMIPVIQETHRLNSVGAEVHQEILGSTSGQRRFIVCDEFLGSSTEEAQGRVITVEGKSWIDRVNEWKPSLVVMDIEGGEAEIISLGMPDCIKRLCVEFHPALLGVEKQNELIASLHFMGFETVYVRGQVYGFSR
jgi:FkbM family methyltransferase